MHNDKRRKIQNQKYQVHFHISKFSKLKIPLNEMNRVDQELII